MTSDIVPLKKWNIETERERTLWVEIVSLRLQLSLRDFFEPKERDNLADFKRLLSIDQQEQE